MFYSPKEIIVDAIQLPTRFTVGDVTGNPGDWLICDPDGDVSILPDSLFQKLFEANEEPALPSTDRATITNVTLEELVDAAAKVDASRLDFPEDLPDIGAVADIAAAFGVTVLDAARAMNVTVQAGQESLERVAEAAASDDAPPAAPVTALDAARAMSVTIRDGREVADYNAAPTDEGCSHRLGSAPSTDLPFWCPKCGFWKASAHAFPLAPSDRCWVCQQPREHRMHGGGTVTLHTTTGLPIRCEHNFVPVPVHG